MKKTILMIISAATLSCAVSTYASDANSSQLNDSGNFVTIVNYTDTKYTTNSTCGNGTGWTIPDIDANNFNKPANISLKLNDPDDYTDDVCQLIYTDANDPTNGFVLNITGGDNYSQILIDRCTGSDSTTCSAEQDTTMATLTKMS